MTRARVQIAPITVDAIKNWKPLDILKAENENTARWLEIVARPQSIDDILVARKLSLLATESLFRDFERAIGVRK